MNTRHLKCNDAGFSLFELMIATAIGLTVLASSLSFFTYSMRSNADSIMIGSLNKELTSIINLMHREIQRAGYWQNADMESSNQYGISVVRSNCILYNYYITDTNEVDTGIPQTNEQFGFRLNESSIIEWLRDGNGTANDCDNDGIWNEISNPNTVIVSDLNYTELNSSCTNISAIPRTNCNPNDCDYTPWQDDDRTIEVRHLTISMTGHLPNDESISTTLTDSIRLRNDRLVTKQGGGPAIQATGCTA